METVALPQKRINFYDLTLSVEGDLEYEINGKDCIIKQGEALFAPPGTVRARKKLIGKDYYCFNFITEEPCDFPPVITGAYSSVIKSLLYSFDAIYKETPNCLDERLVLILECILKQLKAQRKSKVESELVLRIKQHVKERIHEKISLAWISKFTFFSVSYCEYVFKKETGMSITDYILEERIAVAKRLLWENHYSLKKIAEMVGFSDYNYFARTFKKRTGYTPTEYLKKSVL
jgi:AraC-like DNA-binding protein